MKYIIKKCKKTLASKNSCHCYAKKDICRDNFKCRRGEQSMHYSTVQCTVQIVGQDT